MKIDLATKLNDIEMSARLRNQLANAGVTTIQNLVDMSEGELRRVPNIGRISIAELKEILAWGDLRLRPHENKTPASSKLLQEIHALREQVAHLHGVVCELCTRVKDEEFSLRREMEREISGFRNRITRSDVEMAKVVQDAGQRVSAERSLEYRIQRIEEHLGMRAPRGALLETPVMKQ